MTDQNALGPGGYLEQTRLLERTDTGLFFLGDFRGVPRGILSAEEQAVLADFREGFARRSLLGGAAPWLLGSPPVGVDWQRYDAFFTAWGVALWKVIDANGLGGRGSPRVIEVELSSRVLG